MVTEMEEAFDGLESSLTKLETFIAWRDLEMSEHQPSWPFGQRGELTQIELRAEVGRFWNIVFQIRELEVTLTDSEREGARERLGRLIARFRKIEHLVTPQGL
jgi:hypothetical protein